MFVAATLLLLGSAPSEARVYVFAAASLKDAFTAIARKFERNHADTKVVLNFGGSQLLAAQINLGAPADVFASAAMKNLTDTSYDKTSVRVFAHNRLTVISTKPMSLVDLVTAKRLVIADPVVPAGRYTQEFFMKAGIRYGGAWLRHVRSHIVSKEQDVRAVLAKVRTGEADAGIVYVSDAAAAQGAIRTVAIPDELNSIAEYPAAVPTTSVNKTGAHDFVKFLFSVEAQRALTESGFISPLKAVSAIRVSRGAGHVNLKLPFTGKTCAVDATVHGNTEHFSGITVESALALGKATRATFFSADGCRQTIAVADLRGRKAVLVCRADGNYQLIVPSLNADTWVEWIRRIDLQ